jgi:hypothetical protein
MTLRYVNGGTLPKSVGRGRVLMHSHVIHSPDMVCGTNGFRGWTDTRPPAGFVLCPCGWAGLEHYAHRDHVAAYRRNPKDWHTAREL